MDDVSSLARLLLMTLITHDDAVHRSLSLQQQSDDSYAPLLFSGLRLEMRGNGLQHSH